MVKMSESQKDLNIISEDQFMELFKSETNNKKDMLANKIIYRLEFIQKIITFAYKNYKIGHPRCNDNEFIDYFTQVVLGTIEAYNKKLGSTMV